MNPTVVFSTPRSLPKPDALAGRVVVLDIAFAADGLGKSFSKTTLRFIQTLGSRLALWVDHHDHERHIDFISDTRFVLCKKSEHGACPEIITEAMVSNAGPVDTIVCHLDLDGIYAAAKWIRGGIEPYPGADQDAWAVDTRLAQPSRIGQQIDWALRVEFQDESLRYAVLNYLVSGLKNTQHLETIERAAEKFEFLLNQTKRIAERYKRIGRVAFVHIQQLDLPHLSFDKTELLLMGQEIADVAIVHDGATITAAAKFGSSINFIELLNLQGGMPTRVSLSATRLPELMEKLGRMLN